MALNKYWNRFGYKCQFMRGNVQGISYFGFYNRLGKSPSLECSAKDSFTVSPNNGNGKLTYPIALLTGDEVMLAGGTTSSNSSYYLYYSSSYWLMTPAYTAFTPSRQ